METSRNRFDRHHTDRHGLALRLDHIVHSELFWPVMILMVFLALLIAATIWATMTSSQTPTWPGPYPYGY